MIYFVLISALVFVPTAFTFVDAVRLPQQAYSSLMAAICCWQVKKTELLGPWLFYLGVVALSSLVAFNSGMFLSRFSLDLLGAVFFWRFAQAPNLDTRRVGWFACTVAVVVVGLYSYGWLRGEVERIAGIVAMAAPLVPGGWIAGMLVLGWLRRRTAFAALAIAVAGAHFRRVVVLGVVLLMLGGFWYTSSDMAGRIKTWGIGLQIAQGSPVLGVGRGNLPISLYPYSPSLPYHEKQIRAFLDNDYLDLLAEAGPVALLAYVYLLVAILRENPKTSKQRSLYASLLTMLIRGVFHSAMISPAGVAWFWALAGVYWRERNVETDLLISARPLRYVEFGPPGCRARIPV